jgi:hypothetical protein
MFAHSVGEWSETAGEETQAAINLSNLVRGQTLFRFFDAISVNNDFCYFTKAVTIYIT